MPSRCAIENDVEVQLTVLVKHDHDESLQGCEVQLGGWLVFEFTIQSREVAMIEIRD